MAKVPPKKPIRIPDDVEDTSRAFLIRPEGDSSEMPGVSRLLNRKKLKGAPQGTKTDKIPPPENTSPLSPSIPEKEELTMESFVFDSNVFLEQAAGASANPTPPLPTPVVKMPEPTGTGIQLEGVGTESSITFNLETFAEAQQHPEPKKKMESVSTQGISSVVPGRRARAQMQALAIWDKSVLKKSKDSIAKILMSVPESNLVAAVFLSARQEKGSLVFLSTAAYSPGERVEVWTGLVWDPRIVSELWNHFVQKGYVELTPPGVDTLITSNRNVTRATFGVETDEYLTLFQIGPKNQFRGLLAVITRQSLETKSPELYKIASAP